ncbi:MAG: NAD(P)H-dependent oxidoreductase subunit E [Candidatus Magasanikbacteria bacterium]|nr:NAD(P)H-dependent oxidoreductase subunit E [Candidatus Magasanikbacteria bacterium]
MKKIRICNGISCNKNGAERIMRNYEKKYNLKAGVQNGKIDLDFKECGGDCCGLVNIKKGDKYFSVYKSGKEMEKINKDYKIDLKDNFLGDI